jgi:deoxyadenosine/deoxycytidine kinase
MSLFVALAGNIGVGKTTVTNLIAETFGYRRLLEPVVDNRFLSSYYEDMERWSFTLQMEFLLRRIEHHHQVDIGDHNYIQDRTLLEDPEIFAKYLHGLGNMNDNELDLYFDYCRMLIPTVRQPDRIIFLECSDVNILLRRIAERGRPEERGITAQFLRGLAHYYGTFSEVCQRKYDIPTLTIDVSQIDVRKDSGREAFLAKLRPFLEKPRPSSGQLFEGV